jgi:hypothetical protein
MSIQLSSCNAHCLRLALTASELRRHPGLYSIAQKHILSRELYRKSFFFARELWNNFDGVPKNFVILITSLVFTKIIAFIAPSTT